MRAILGLLLLVQLTDSYAGCKVFAPVKMFYHEGYHIFFDFDNLLKEKNYKEVESEQEADYILNVSGQEVEGRFHKAVTTMEMGGISSESSVVCLNQLCWIADFVKSFNKVYKNFGKKIPVCRN